MKLLPNWKEILLKAWSVRVLALAGLLTGIEQILPTIGLYVPEHVFVILEPIVICAALVARILAQREADGVNE